MGLDPMPSARELRAMAAQRGVTPSQIVSAPRSTRKAPSVRQWHPYRSKWERDYSRYLEVLKAARVIRDWQYETDTLLIGVGARYTPDFVVLYWDTEWVESMEPGARRYRREYHEVKGYKREAAMVRLRAAAKQYPQFTFVLVTRSRGSWIHTPII